MDVPAGGIFATLSAKDAGLESALNRLGSRLDSIGASIKGIGLALAGAFAIEKIGSGLGMAVEKASDLESRMANLARVTGLGGVALDSVGAKLKGIGQTLAGVKLGSVLDIATAGAKQGVDGSQIATFTRSVAELSVALDDMPIGEASERIGRLLNVFQRGTADVGRFGSMLVALDQASTASGRDILDITTRVAPMANVLKMSAAETMALATALRESGVQAEVAGSALAQLLGKMASTKSMPAFAKVSGMSGGEWKGLMKASPAEAIKALASSISEMDPTEAIDSLGKLGLEGVRTRQALLGLASVIPKLQTFTATANREFRTMAAVAGAVAIKGNTTAAQMDRLRNILDVTAARIGSFFLPLVKAGAEAIGELGLDAQRALDRNAGTLDRWSAKVAGVMRLAGLAWREWPTMIALATAKAKESLERFAEVAKRFGGQLWANLTWGARTAAVVLEDTFRGLGAFLADLFGQLGKVIGASIHNGIASAIEGMSPQLKGFMEGLFRLEAGALDIKRVDVPKIAPHPEMVRPFGRVQAPPGFNLGALVRDLPNRDKEINALADKLRGAKRVKDVQAAAGKAGDFVRRMLGQPQVAPAVRERQRVELGAQRDRIALMEPGRRRRQAEAKLRDDASKAGFPAADFRVPSLLEARKAQFRERRRQRDDAQEERRARRHPLTGASALGVLTGRGVQNLGEAMGLPSGVAKGLGILGAGRAGGLSGFLRQLDAIGRAQRGETRGGGVMGRDGKPVPSSKAEDEVAKNTAAAGPIVTELKKIASSNHRPQIWGAAGGGAVWG